MASHPHWKYSNNRNDVHFPSYIEYFNALVSKKRDKGINLTCQVKNDICSIIISYK